MKIAKWSSIAVFAALLLATTNLFAATTATTVELVGGGGVPGYVDGATYEQAFFSAPCGIALDNTGEFLFIADRDNNAIRQIDLPNDGTITFTIQSISKPVGVALDSSGNVYVLNRGNGNNGTVVEFDGEFGNLIATNAAHLTNATAMALDASGNIFVTIKSNTVIRITAPGVSNVVATIPDAGAYLQGIVLKKSGSTAGLLAVCDSGRNGILLVNPTNGVVTTNAGFHGAGDFPAGSPDKDSSANARFNQPMGVVEAGDGSLIVTDYGNNRVKVVRVSDGSVTNLFGVTNADWVGPYPGFSSSAEPRLGRPPEAVKIPDAVGGVSARLPFGVALAPDGSVYVTEQYYHIIRHVAGAGFQPPPSPPPAAPTILTVTTNFGQVTLTWSTVTGATNYNVKRSHSSGGTYVKIASTPFTSYTDTTVVNGTTYYYVVSAVANGGVEGTNSLEVSATPPLPPVPDPQIGYVDFPPPLGTSVFHPVSSAGATFNNDVPIVIIGAAGSQTFYTYSNTPAVTNLPDPTAASSSAPLGYMDGLSSVAGLTVAQIFPKVAIKAIGEESGHPNSAIVSSLIQFVAGNPGIYGANAALFAVSNITVGAQMYYTTDGSDPTNDGSGTSIGPITSGTLLSLNVVSTNLQFKIRGFRANYQPSSIVTNFFSAASFVANAISFGTPHGEPSSKFMARPGQFYYAPVTLEMLPGFGGMYSLQFNVTVTNGLANTHKIVNGAGIDFFSMLMTQVTPDEGRYFPPANGSWYLSIPPIRAYNLSSSSTNYVPTTFVNTNNNLLGVGWVFRTGFIYLYPDPSGQIILDFDTSKQDLTAFSIAHDTLFTEANGKIVVGAYSFLIPTNANIGDKYFIQLGSPSATKDGVGAPGASIYIQPPATNQAVTVGSPTYLVGDAAPFHWLNAGDFGDTNLDSADVQQVYQAAIVHVDLPPLNSDLYRAMDSCGDIGISNAATGYFTDGGSFLALVPVTNTLTFNNLFITNDIALGSLGSSLISSFTITNITITATTNFIVFTTNIVYTISSNSVPIPSSTVTIVVANNVTFNNNNFSVLFNGNDQTINQIAFGDGNLDIADLYVTFRRSLDPSLFWFERYWTNGQFVAVTTINQAFNTNIPSLHLTASAAQPAYKSAGQTYTHQQSFVSFTAGDAQGSAGQTVQIPITANVFGSYPLRVLGLNLTVFPLDGSPDLTQPVQFTPAAGLGAPSSGFATSKGNDTYAAAWLDSTISGLSGNATIGTLTITLPANATSSSAYAIHFEHASGSPNGLASFPKQTLTGLITLSSRTNSYYHDGIPDSWRLRYFGTVYNLLSVSNACPSGDGVNNWGKYVAGIDPNTPDNFPSLNARTPVPSGATAAIHWPTVSGKQYVILRSSNLFPGKWTTISTNTGTGTDMEFDDSTAGQTWFYRVLILP